MMPRPSTTGSINPSVNQSNSNHHSKPILPKSWSEALEIYQQSKSIVPPLNYVPPRRPQTAFNPITGISKHPSDDQSRPSTAAPPKRSLYKRQASYNIISNEPPNQWTSQFNKPSSQSNNNHQSLNLSQPNQSMNHQSNKQEEKDCSPLPPRTLNPHQSEFNIINNHWAFTDSQKLVEQSDSINQSRAQNKRALKTKIETREFDVVRNVYFKSNTARMNVERSVLLAEKERILNLKQPFNPIKVAFVDPKREAAYQKQLYEAQMQHGRAKLERLPPYYKNSEGANESIIR